MELKKVAESHLEGEIETFLFLASHIYFVPHKTMRQNYSSAFMTDLVVARTELNYWPLNFIHETIATMEIYINMKYGAL